MIAALRQYRSFDRPVRLLVLNQFAINLGFYLLMPYLADHLAHGLGLAAATVGLVLGVRNFAQQGMFFVGGTLAERFGYKPVIMAGCALRTLGFGLLAVTSSVTGLVVAAVLTGFAGALFNPAVRAYLAAASGERDVEAFALFNVFYQAGILLGPLAGLTGLPFRAVCVVAAVLFALLTVLQWANLPAMSTGSQRESVVSGWRAVLTNGRFILFAVAMSGSYVLSFQTYLALPLEARRLTGEGATIVVAAMFALSGLAAVVAQVPITEWCRARWSRERALSVGLLVMTGAFVVPMTGWWPGVILCGIVLAIGTAIVFPLEMDLVAELADRRLVAVHYGVYQTVCGLGIVAGNVLIGEVIDRSQPWLWLIVLGCVSVCGFSLLSGRVSRIERGS